MRPVSARWYCGEIAYISAAVSSACQPRATARPEPCSAGAGLARWTNEPDAPIRRHTTGMGQVIRHLTAAILAVAIPASLGLWGPARVVATTLGPRSATLIAMAESDATPPVTLPPVVRLLKDATAVASAVPVTISWPAATDTGTGVATYELRRRFDGGAWAAVALPTALAMRVWQDLPPTRA